MIKIWDFSFSKFQSPKFSCFRKSFPFEDLFSKYISRFVLPSNCFDEKVFIYGVSLKYNVTTGIWPHETNFENLLQKQPLRGTASFKKLEVVVQNEQNPWKASVKEFNFQKGEGIQHSVLLKNKLLVVCF